MRLPTDGEAKDLVLFTRRTKPGKTPCLRAAIIANPQETEQFLWLCCLQDEGGVYPADIVCPWGAGTLPKLINKVQEGRGDLPARLWPCLTPVPENLAIAYWHGTPDDRVACERDLVRWAICNMDDLSRMEHHYRGNDLHEAMKLIS